jgi:hypothetical protein
MKRSAIKRGKPLARKTRIKAKRATPRRGPAREPARLAWIRTLACAVSWSDCVYGYAVVAHHAGRHAAGKKCPDSEAIPLCQGHHDHLHSLTGPFRHWKRDAVRAWEDEQIAYYQAFYALRMAA